jgi:amino acid adenylation domain-containing protein
MIIAWAKATPDAVAAVDGDRLLTYRRLVTDAARIARAVRQAGVGRDEVVGLAGERGLDSLTALLGILLSGAAYLYLDPTWPAERRAYMARECRLDLLLIGPGGAADDAADGVDGGSAAQRLHVDALSMESAARWPNDAARSEDLCYVVYTSGSSGTPKGVAVEHGGAGNMARQLAAAFGISPGVRMLQFASWAWDAAACEILMTLGAGGTLVLAGDATRHGGEELARLLREQRVQAATLTPSVLAALPEAELPSLRTVVAVGEPCPPELVARWGRGRRFINGYGPSEATVAVSVGRCRPGEPVTIGRPLPGVRVRVVGPDGAPVLPGHPGELVVGGRGVARGYVTPAPDGYPGPGPAVTPGERFFSAAGGRWYRTGDLVHQAPDGSLFYRGRADDQVKVRGHRVELAEVEQSLRRHPGVRQCAVAAGGGRLVAYVVPGAPVLSADEVLAEAARWLPDFMLPQEVRVVDTLPLTGNGKLNRHALTAMSVPEPSTVDGVLADTLALVRQALEIEQVGPDDDVFEAGGHSLVAAQLAVAATERFGVPVAALQVYDHPTPARLAALISTLAPPGKAA